VVAAGTAAAVLLAGGVVAVVRHSSTPTHTVVRTAAPPTTDTSLDLPTVTTTTVTLPPTTLPPVTIPPLPKLTTTTVRRTTTTTAPKRVSGADCGTPTGVNGLGADTSATVGQTTATLEVYPCHVYDEDGGLQNWVIVDNKDATLTSVHVDYGDGTTWNTGSSWACPDPKRPNPYYVNDPWHHYQPGRYTITATVVTTSCTDNSQTTVTVTIPVFRESGKRPS